MAATHCLLGYWSLGLEGMSKKLIRTKPPTAVPVRLTGKVRTEALSRTAGGLVGKPLPWGVTGCPTYQWPYILQKKKTEPRRETFFLCSILQASSAEKFSIVPLDKSNIKSSVPVSHSGAMKCALGRWGLTWTSITHFCERLKRQLPTWIHFTCALPHGSWSCNRNSLTVDAEKQF